MKTWIYWHILYDISDRTVLELLTNAKGRLMSWGLLVNCIITITDIKTNY